MTSTFRFVGYCYPTSELAVQLGAGSSGCWYCCVTGNLHQPLSDYRGPFDTMDQAESDSLAIDGELAEDWYSMPRWRREHEQRRA